MKLTVISQESSLLPNVFKGNEAKIAYSLAIFAIILFASPFATTATTANQKDADHSAKSAKVMHAKSTTANK